MPGAFMLADLAGILVSVAVLPLFLILPGYPLARSLNLANFRRRPLLHRALLALPLAIAALPILTHLAARLAGPLHAFTLIIGLDLLALHLIRRDARLPPRRLLQRPVAILFAITAAITALTLADLQLGPRLYPNAVPDFGFRSSLTSHLASVPALPPDSPFFDSPNTPFRYHYLWFWLLSLPVRLSAGLLQARWVLAAGAVWLLLALWTLTFLFLRDLFPRRPGLGRRTLWSALLLALGGFDILMLPIARPWLSRDVWGAAWPGEFPSTDLWNLSMISGWPHILFNVPHHAAALVACLVALFLLHSTSSRLRIPFAALALASAFGMSVHVFFVFAAFLAVWAFELQRRRDYTSLRTLALAGLLALICALPLLLEFTPAAPGAFARFQVRRLTLLWALLSRIPGVTLGLALALDTVLLPLHYFLELGLVAIPTWLALRNWKRGPRIIALMAAVSLVVTAFFASANTPTNDIGWRGTLPLQFAALIFTAVWLDRVRPLRLRSLTALALAIGLATTALELWKFRTFFPRLEARGAHTPTVRFYSQEVDPRDFGAIHLERRQAMEYLNSVLPPGARIQARPAESVNPLYSLYAARPFFLEGVNNAKEQGVPETEVDSRWASVAPAFESPGATTALCNHPQVAAWLVSSTDPVWRDSDSWVWRLPPSWTSPHFRIFLRNIAFRLCLPISPAE